MEIFWRYWGCLSGRSIEVPAIQSLTGAARLTLGPNSGPAQEMELL